MYLKTYCQAFICTRKSLEISYGRWLRQYTAIPICIGQLMTIVQRNSWFPYAVAESNSAVENKLKDPAKQVREHIQPSLSQRLHPRCAKQNDVIQNRPPK